MTKIRPDSPVVRQTDAYERTDALIVELHPRYLKIRLKGQREALIVDYGAILELARRASYKKQRGA
jgi:hypothetical protein